MVMLVPALPRREFMLAQSAYVDDIYRGNKRALDPTVIIEAQGVAHAG